MPSTTTKQDQAADQAAEAFATILAAALFGPPAGGKPKRQNTEQPGAATNAEAASPETEAPQDQRVLDAEKRAAADELDRVLVFIRTMPTWHQAEVTSVRNWLLDQLLAGKHRRD